jgi:hypothetical protein
MSKYELRNFVEGDEEKIVKLFNDIYGRFGGYVPRTVEYWRWCCLKRPDVRRDGIFLVFDKETGNIEGYVVAGLSGNIWELCSRPDHEDVALILLDKAVRFLEEMDISLVNVNVPKSDEVLNEACSKMGFDRVNVHKMFVGVLSFRKLISLLVRDRAETLSKKFEEKICIKVKDAPFWIEKAIFVSVHNGGFDVDEVPLLSPTISIQTDAKTLSSILFGVLSPWRALLSFRVSVKPFWKIPRIMNFLCSIRLGDSWFWPLSDFG